MKKLLVFGLVALLSANVSANADTDWTPLFKSWEKSCNSNTSLDNLYYNLYPNIFWPKNIEGVGSKQKIPTSSGKVVLPQQYKPSITGKIRTVFGSNSNNEKPYLTLEESSSYAHITFPVKGSYRKMPISKIGYYAGIENGINIKYFVIDLPKSQVSKKLSPLIKHTHYDEYVDSYDGWLGMHLKRLNTRQTMVECDFSN